MTTVLTIAGSDSIAGAGIQADLKTFYAHNVYGMSVITAITAQNTRGIIGIEEVSNDILEKQIDAIFSDCHIDAIKIGMLSSSKCVEIVVNKIKEYNPKIVVLDPIIISSSGSFLLDSKGLDLLISKLMPLSTLITPNIPEAEKITGISINSLSDMVKAAEKILTMGINNVLIKGGHSIGKCHDVLLERVDSEKGAFQTIFSEERINKNDVHGTGCTLSSSITANLALGYDLKQSIKNSKEYITKAISNSIKLGSGSLIINH